MTDSHPALQRAHQHERHAPRPVADGGPYERAIRNKMRALTGGEITLHTRGVVDTYGESGHGLSAAMEVHDRTLFRRMVLGGSLGFAESYLDGQWDTDNLTALLRVLVRNIDAAHQLQRGLARVTEPVRRLAHAWRSNTRTGSRRNIAAHYDLGNEFFELFLDDTMTYSCGIFETEGATMRDASIAKLDRICRKLRLDENDHLLEIGTGWGSFALHAARHYGCRVTTTTISKEQHAVATERVRAEGLADRITLLLQDYRDLTGSFDKLASIEMIEAVGHRYLDTFFGSCDRLLKPHGQACIQAITMPDQHYDAYRRRVDFIQKHVFPGSNCPSPGAISASVSRASALRLVHAEDITPHYATTLERWREAFDQKIDRVRELGYPERFVRLWRYYLSYCEAGFAERYIGTVQLVFNKPRCFADPILGRFG